MSVQHEAFAEANVLKERAAASYIGVSLSTLRRRRAARRRPAFIQIDRSIGYRRTELDSFLDDSTVRPDEQQEPATEQGSQPEGDAQPTRKPCRRKKGKAN